VRAVANMMLLHEAPDHDMQHPAAAQVATNLRVYLEQPELVEGWITPQAVALRDGTIRHTQYFETPSGGLILRASLEADHPESEQGLVRRFRAGERYSPIFDGNANPDSDLDADQDAGPRPGM